MYRIPYHQTPLGFSVAVIFSLLACSASAIACIAFTVIYISTCSNISSFVSDISLIITQSNKDIRRKTSITHKLQEFIEIHLQCYRYEAASNFIDSAWSSKSMETARSSLGCYIFSKLYYYWLISMIILFILLSQRIGNAWRNHPRANFLSSFNFRTSNCSNFVYTWNGMAEYYDHLKFNLRVKKKPKLESDLFRFITEYNNIFVWFGDICACDRFFHDRRLYAVLFCFKINTWCYIGCWFDLWPDVVSVTT